MDEKITLQIFSDPPETIEMNPEEALEVIRNLVKNKGMMLYLDRHHIADVDELNPNELREKDQINLGYALVGG